MAELDVELTPYELKCGQFRSKYPVVPIGLVVRAGVIYIRIGNLSQSYFDYRIRQF